MIAELQDAGIITLLPFGGGCSFDIGAVLPDDSLVRVQVECGWIQKGVVHFNSHSTDHGRGAQGYQGRADVFAVYVPALRQLFMVPVSECPTSKGWLRLEPTRNNQRVGVRMAEDYTFERWVASVVEGPAALRLLG